VSIENLKRTFDLANEFDISVGRGAYRKYNRIMCKLAEKCGTTPRIASAVFAALSPNNDYHGNLRDTHTVLMASKQNLFSDEFKVSTYGNNKRKALYIADGADPLDQIRAKKTRNFFLNVDNPIDREPVTIDGHMINIWRGWRERLVGLRSTPALYDEIADGVRRTAAGLDLIPCELQAILWITWRRIHGIKTSQQMELWDAELLAARCGYHPVD